MDSDYGRCERQRQRDGELHDCDQQRDQHTERHADSGGADRHADPSGERLHLWCGANNADSHGSGGWWKRQCHSAGWLRVDGEQ